jgi:hypothetical protein
MFRITQCIFVTLLVTAMSGPATAVIIVDDFSDNSMSSMWTLVQDDPQKMWLEEANQRLELLADGPLVASTDALYLSNGTTGFQLLTSSDFQVTIDFSFTGFSGTGAIALDLGIGRDLDGTDSAAVGFYRSDNLLLDQALGVGYRIDDVQTSIPIDYVGTSGSFTILYDSDIDQLKLGLNDGNPAHMTSLNNLVKGDWNAGMVWVSFGGRGDGLTLASGDAYLDNLLVSGEYIPEPATIILFALGGLPLLRKKRKT